MKHLLQRTNETISWECQYSQVYKLLIFNIVSNAKIDSQLYLHCVPINGPLCSNHNLAKYIMNFDSFWLTAEVDDVHNYVHI